MSAAAKSTATPEQYLTWERAAEKKHEFVNGEIFAMAGASLDHVKIVGNLSFALRSRLHGSGCHPYASDLRIKVPDTGLYTYPDIAIVCGDPISEDDYADTILNPTVIVEVLSPSTENYDRGAKFQHYKRLPSLQNYVLVTQKSFLVEVFVRLPDERWTAQTYVHAGNEMELPALGVSIPLAEIYEDVDVESDPRSSPGAF